MYKSECYFEHRFMKWRQMPTELCLSRATDELRTAKIGAQSEFAV
jgi:hypothetical protein